MKAHKPSILTINGGSSSIKFALYDTTDPLLCTLSGNIERINLSDTKLNFSAAKTHSRECLSLPEPDHQAAITFLLDWLAQQPAFSTIEAIGHRVVHGMQHSEACLITPTLLAELQQISAFDPEHLPFELNLIKSCAKRFPKLPQYACFDTAFHRSMPKVATLVTLPRRYAAQGVQRYGFHGLSYAYLLAELKQLNDPAASKGRVILAHLGNGASIAAVLDGECLDTSMGFTPSSGLVMGSRSGDLDPGLVSFLLRTEKMTAAQFQHLVNHESGLLGVSETSSDMRDLLAQEAEDSRAAEAVALFCYTVKKQIGAYIAALGGIDTLVFAGGIGENAPLVRSRICEGLGFLGIELDEQQNKANHAGVISRLNQPVSVRVMHTDEELMIARSVYHLHKSASSNEQLPSV